MSNREVRDEVLLVFRTQGVVDHNGYETLGVGMNPDFNGFWGERVQDRVK